MNNSKVYRLVFFSGTGGTRRAVDNFEQALFDRGLQVIKTELKASFFESNDNVFSVADSEMLVLFYPVYSFNESTPAAEWLKRLPVLSDKQFKLKAAVISVSGGGEIASNSACRHRVIKKLEKKGFDVFYENMLIMPNNAFSAYDDYLSARLLQVLPDKTAKIAEEIVLDTRRRIKPLVSGKLIAAFGNMEKKFEKIFGKNLRADDNCNSCGWCADNCPRGNIVMRGERPSFDSKCVICLRCVYGCPKRAISPKFGKSLVIKEGYDLKAVEKTLREQPEKTANCPVPGGSSYAGIRKYLGTE